MFVNWQFAGRRTRTLGVGPISSIFPALRKIPDALPKTPWPLRKTGAAGLSGAALCDRRNETAIKGRPPTAKPSKKSSPRELEAISAPPHRKRSNPGLKDNVSSPGPNLGEENRHSDPEPSGSGRDGVAREAEAARWLPFAPSPRCSAPSPCLPTRLDAPAVRPFSRPTDQLRTALPVGIVGETGVPSLPAPSTAP